LEFGRNNGLKPGLKVNSKKVIKAGLFLIWKGGYYS